MIIFSEYAFSKLRWFRINCNDNNIANHQTKDPSFLEVSLMGISQSDENIGNIIDFRCVPQEASSGLTEPTDDGMNTYIENMLIDEEISIVRSARFWAHTHPGKSPTPSQTDNETFHKWFANSDIGVMYILADGDDSCNVKHQSKYFGPQRETMPCYIELEKVDDKNQKIIISTRTFFAINKLGLNDGYSDLADLMMYDYSAFHKEWMKELKENVKKKYLHQTTQYTGHYHPNNYGSFQNWRKDEQQQKPNNTAGTGVNTATDSTQTYSIKKYNISCEDLIQILIENKKETIFEFDDKQKEKICEIFRISLEDLQAVFNRIKLFEESFKPSDVMLYETILIDQNGKSKFDQLPQLQLVNICKKLAIRPTCLNKTLDSYIQLAFNPKTEV